MPAEQQGRGPDVDGSADNPTCILMKPDLAVTNQSSYVYIYNFCILLTLVLLNPDIPSLCNNVDPDQLASEKPTDLDLHCLPISIRIYINNLDQVIWLAEILKRVWHLLFSRTRVKTCICSDWVDTSTVVLYQKVCDWRSPKLIP